jgi:hypothetical protein
MSVNYKCDFCQYETIHKAKFARHVKSTKHIISELGIECCGITYYEKHQWVNHKRSLKHHHRILCGEIPKDRDKIGNLVKSYVSPIIEIPQKSVHLQPTEPRQKTEYPVEEKVSKAKLNKLMSDTPFIVIVIGPIHSFRNDGSDYGISGPQGP